MCEPHVQINQLTAEYISSVVDVIEHDAVAGHYLPFAHDLLHRMISMIANVQLRPANRGILLGCTGFVVKCDGGFAGFYTMSELPKAVLGSIYPMETRELHQFSIHPGYRCKKIGGQLLDHAITQHSHSSIFARCLPQSAAFSLMAQKRGFSVIGSDIGTSNDLLWLDRHDSLVKTRGELRKIGMIK